MNLYFVESLILRSRQDTTILQCTTTYTLPELMTTGILNQRRIQGGSIPPNRAPIGNIWATSCPSWVRLEPLCPPPKEEEEIIPGSATVLNRLHTALWRYVSFSLAVSPRSGAVRRPGLASPPWCYSPPQRTRSVAWTWWRCGWDHQWTSVLAPVSDGDVIYCWWWL